MQLLPESLIVLWGANHLEGNDHVDFTSNSSRVSSVRQQRHCAPRHGRCGTYRRATCDHQGRSEYYPNRAMERRRLGLGPCCDCRWNSGARSWAARWSLLMAQATMVLAITV